MKLSTDYLKAIEAIKATAGPEAHLKFEFEADLEREYGRECDYCNSGEVECSACDGRGYEEEYDEELEEYVQAGDCQNCYGSSYVTCSECGGEYQDAEWYDEACQNFIENHINAETAQDITFMQFENDGSVDSELTFTLPADKAHLALDVMDAFKALADEIGNGLSVSNAGMHISVLTDGHIDRSGFDADKLQNFQREVTKLLPALYAVACPNERTRGLQFRMPAVSLNEKYNAVYLHGGRFIEYRIFDTCYDRPEALLENIEVIAQTLKFYSLTKKANVKYKQFNFGRMRELNDLYNTPENIRALNETLKHVKPVAWQMYDVASRKVQLYDLAVKKFESLLLAEEAGMDKALKLTEPKGA